MKNKPFIYVAVIILLLFVGAIIYQAIWLNNSQTKTINTDKKPPADFNECLAYGFIVQESYPRRCIMTTNKVFVEDIGNELEKLDLIVVDNPRPNTNIKSPLTITGKARGRWFFEASFPISLVDINNQEIAFTIAQAQTDWMTENFVPFTAKLIIPETLSGPVKLILKKDNPSGIENLADQLIIPLVVAQ
jgi:hypothetical protein